MSKPNVVIDGKVIKEIRLYTHGEWSAVYINGQLADGPHDSYLCDEYLRGLLGVQDIDDASFLLGTESQRQWQAARTTDEIDAYEEQLQEDLLEATKLKQKIALMQQEVDKLDPTGRLKR